MNLQLFAANFKPTYWSKYCQTELAKDLVVANWCDYKFEGELKYGEALNIPGAVRPTVKTYTPGTDITIESLSDTEVKLEIKFADYFAFEVDDVDKAQSRPEYLTTQFDEAKKSLAEQYDAAVAKEAATNAEPTMTSASTLITSDNCLSVIDAGLIALYKNNVSTKEELAADLTPEHLVAIRNKLANLFSDNVEYIKRGAVGKYNQTFLRLSNNLYNDKTDTHELIRTKKAVACANQIDKMETTRKEKGFASIIKGLNVYGIKVVRPKEMYVIKSQNA